MSWLAIYDYPATLQPGVRGKPRRIIRLFTTTLDTQVELARDIIPGQQFLGNQHLDEARVLPGRISCRNSHQPPNRDCQSLLVSCERLRNGNFRVVFKAGG